MKKMIKKLVVRLLGIMMIVYIFSSRMLICLASLITTVCSIICTGNGKSRQALVKSKR